MRYLDPYPAGWKFFLDSYLKKVGGKFLFHCNFNFERLSIAISDFYKECLILWSSMNKTDPSTLEEIANEVIWNNKYICIGGKSVFSTKICEHGLYKVGDLYDSAGELVIGGEFWRSALSPIDSFLLFSIYKALPLHWRNILCTNRGLIPLYTQHINLSTFYSYINNEGINVEKLQSKFLYGSLISRIANMPTAIKKYEDLYNTESSQLNWKDIFLLPLKVTLSTKLRKFQYKTLNRILYTNKMLYKCEKVESPLCYLCKADIETLEHFFFYCPRVVMFWNEVVNLFRDQLKISKDFEITDVIFGLSNKETYSSLINYIILEGKYLPHLSKLNDSFFISKTITRTY